jgi:hypothetical protein
VCFKKAKYAVFVGYNRPMAKSKNKQKSKTSAKKSGKGGTKSTAVKGKKSSSSKGKKAAARKKIANGKPERVRPAAKGDTAPSTDKIKIEHFEVNEGVEAARLRKINAVKDIVDQVPPHDVQTLSRVLKAVIDGTSLDDAMALREALLDKPNMGTGRRRRADDQLAADWRSGGYPYKNLMSRKAYEKEKYRLQVELLKLQSWVKKTGQKLVIVFEGRDAAGKGGTIKRFMEHLNPRGARVVALEKPTDEEQGQWYFQRYAKHLPTNGEIVLFDRSWYNRAGVERVMGFCSLEEYNEFMRQAPRVRTQPET